MSSFLTTLKTETKENKNHMRIVSLRNVVNFDFLHELSYLENRIQSLRNSTWNPLIFPSLEGILDTSYGILSPQEVRAMSGWPLSQQDFGQKQGELDFISIRAENGFNNQAVNINTKHWLTCDIFLSLEYLKTFQFFKNLKFSDRFILAKDVTILVQTLTFVYTSFEAKSDCFKTPDGCFFDVLSLLQVLRMFNGTSLNQTTQVFKNHIKSSQNIFSTLIREKITKTEYILLKALAIFCGSNFCKLSDDAQKIMALEKQKYVRALFEHLKMRPDRLLVLLSWLNLILVHQKSLSKFMEFMRMFSGYRMAESIRKLEDLVLGIEKN
ncbi:unnamed protein product [Caenorhabditis angaria]|uniref:NR LBD domain-containing protein n=1 Tax=Caenorhabditis angaria TaxID=860376 RepID=A0A9P1I1K1_9PELO|nr:unnamed protein product [Caenorhabditis angaria]